MYYKEDVWKIQEKKLKRLIIIGKNVLYHIILFLLLTYFLYDKLLGTNVVNPLKMLGLSEPLPPV